MNILAGNKPNRAIAVSRLKDLNVEMVAHKTGEQPKLQEWQMAAQIALESIFGAESAYVKTLASIRWDPYMSFSSPTPEEYEEAFRKGASKAIRIVEAAIREAERYDPAQTSTTNPQNNDVETNRDSEGIVMTTQPDGFDRDDRFVKSIARLFVNVPARSVSGTIAVIAFLLGLGWTTAKQLTPPADMRERAALDAARRENSLPLTSETDVPSLIEDLSGKLKNRNAELSQQLAQMRRSNTHKDIAGARDDLPWLALYWASGKVVLERCKREGPELLRTEGFEARTGKDPAGDTAISGSRSGTSAYVLCSDKLSSVVVSVAGYEKGSAEDTTNRLLRRFLPTAQ